MNDSRSEYDSNRASALRVGNCSQYFVREVLLRQARLVGIPNYRYLPRIVRTILTFLELPDLSRRITWTDTLQCNV